MLCYYSMRYTVYFIHIMHMVLIYTVPFYLNKKNIINML